MSAEHGTSAPSGDGDHASSLGSINVTWVLDPFCVWITTVISTIVVAYAISDTREHSLNFTRPTLQRLTIRIQLMVPLYAALSVLTLHLPENRFFIATVRDTYESFVLYEFLALLIAYCGGETQLIQSLTLKRYKGEHPAPCCCLPMFPLDLDFFLRCKRWVLQYALIKPITSVLAIVGHLNGTYRETDFDFSTNLFPWLTVISNFSITYSLWYLVVFEHETARELAYCQPMLKFICIKTIIFFAFWQGLGVSFLVALGFIDVGHDEKEREEVVGAFQDFLICIELVPVAIMHHYAFGYESFKQEMKDEPVFERIDGGYGSKAGKKNQKDSGKKSDADILDEVTKARESEKQAVQKRFQQQQDQSLASRLQKYHNHGAAAAANNPKDQNRLGGKKMSVVIREPNENGREDSLEMTTGSEPTSVPNAAFRKKVATMMNLNRIRNNNNRLDPNTTSVPIYGESNEVGAADYAHDVYDDDDDEDDDDSVDLQTNATTENAEQQHHHNNHHHDPLEDTLSRAVRKKNQSRNRRMNAENDDDDDDDDVLLPSAASLPQDTLRGSISMSDFMRIQKEKDRKSGKVGAAATVQQRKRGSSVGGRSDDNTTTKGSVTSSRHTTAPSTFTTSAALRFNPFLRSTDTKALQQAQAVEDAIDAVETSVLREALALQDFVSDTVSTIFYQGGGLLDTIGGSKSGGGGGGGIGAQDGKGDEENEFDIEAREYNPSGPKFIDPPTSIDGVDGLDGEGGGGLEAIISSQRADGAGGDSDSTDSEAERDDADARGAGWCGDPSMMEFENDGEFPLVPWYDFRTGRRKDALADGSLTAQQQGQQQQSGATLATSALSMAKVYDMFDEEWQRREKEENRLQQQQQPGGKKRSDHHQTVNEFFCTVCGRNDREMVKRSSGYKCVQCVGVKHQYFSPKTIRKSNDSKKNSSSSLAQNSKDEEDGKD